MFGSVLRTIGLRNWIIIMPSAAPLSFVYSLNFTPEAPFVLGGKSSISGIHTMLIRLTRLLRVMPY
jgi:hypothetical protein